jgi:hypothetical protein
MSGRRARPVQALVPWVECIENFGVEKVMFRTCDTSPRARALIAVLALTLWTGCRPSGDRARAVTPAAGSPPAHATPVPVSSAVIFEWNTILHEATKANDGHKHALAAARLLGLMHVAQHDAVNAVAPAYESYAFDQRDPAADPVAAAASAAHAVLEATFPKQAAMLGERLQRSLSERAEPARSRGVALGKRAALAVLERRKGDGSDTPAIGDYHPRSGPGAYQYVPPFEMAFAPGWRQLKPFGLTSPSQFRPGPPPALTSPEYASAFEEVKATGGQGSRSRTPEQSAYAAYWWEFSEIGWNRIARTVAAERNLDLPATARLLALVNIALSDAYVAGWDAKFHYDFWRPYTAIRAGESDGNPATSPDAHWRSAEVTPPVQDYPSTHSALGDAAAEVLASVFGDRTRFTVGSSTAPAGMPTRTFQSFSEAADENADSRVRGGLHFRFSCEEGQKLGRRIGRLVTETQLRPL